MIADFWERAEFPHHLMPRLATLGLGGATLQGYGCPGQSVLGAAMGVIEVARVDGSISTFFLVHNSLAVLTIGAPAPGRPRQGLERAAAHGRGPCALSSFPESLAARVGSPGRGMLARRLCRKRARCHSKEARQRDRRGAHRGATGAERRGAASQ